MAARAAVMRLQRATATVPQRWKSAVAAVPATDDDTASGCQSRESDAISFVSAGLRSVAISMLGGVAAQEKERVDELNVLRSRVVALSAELRGAKAELQDAAIKLATLEQRETREVAVAPSVAATAETHPTYGELVRDFGYKRVYAVKLATLVNPDAFPVWQKQRAYSESRAKKIAKAMATSNSPFPGVIAAYEHEGECAIIDGQHRVGALRHLMAANAWPGDASVLLEVHRVGSMDAVNRLFTDINRAEPLSLVDLPGVVADSQKAVLDEAVGALATEFKSMFSDSRRCRVPHVNVDKLRDDVFESGIMERHGLHTADDLLAWLREVNDELYIQRDRWSNKMAGPTFAKAFDKAKAHHFFLGLDRSWLEL